MDCAIKAAIRVSELIVATIKLILELVVVLAPNSRLIVTLIVPFDLIAA